SSPATPRRRTDGTTSAPLFTVYHPAEDVLSRSVFDLFEDHTGAIWCGTAGGLYQLEQTGAKVSFRFVDMRILRETSDDSLVEKIVEDRQGTLWVGTRRSGLYRRWPDGRVERYSRQQGLPEDRINALLEERDGRLWVGTTGGLCLLEPEVNPNHSVVAHVYTTKNDLPH